MRDKFLKTIVTLDRLLLISLLAIITCFYFIMIALWQVSAIQYFATGGTILLIGILSFIYGLTTAMRIGAKHASS